MKSFRKFHEFWKICRILEGEGTPPPLTTIAETFAANGVSVGTPAEIS